MKKITIILLIAPLLVFAQEKVEKPKVEQTEKQWIRKGNDLYKNQNYSEAEVHYKKALAENPNYEKATYNLGNAIYQQDKFKEALPMYELASKVTESTTTKAESFHNIGNVMMKQKQYAPAVEAFKNALRNNPNDDETRYNLALAQKLLKKEQNQNQDKNDKKDKNKDNKDKKDQDKKDDQNKDKDQDKDKKGDDKDKKKDQDKGDNKQDKGDKEKKQPKPQPNKLTPQQVKQLLEAMNNEENKTQKKVNAKKAKGKKVKQEKDW